MTWGEIKARLMDMPDNADFTAYIIGDGFTRDVGEIKFIKLHQAAVVRMVVEVDVKGAVNDDHSANPG